MPALSYGSTPTIDIEPKLKEQHSTPTGEPNNTTTRVFGSAAKINVPQSAEESKDNFIGSSREDSEGNKLSEFNIMYSMNAKKEPTAFMPTSTEHSVSFTGSSISISDLLSAVNKLFPDVLSDGTDGTEFVFKEKNTTVRGLGRGVTDNGSLANPTSTVDDRSVSQSTEESKDNFIGSSREQDGAERGDCGGAPSPAAAGAPSKREPEGITP